jgi:hypothetical protein
LDLSRYFDYEQRGAPQAGDPARKILFLTRLDRGDWDRHKVLEQAA